MDYDSIRTIRGESEDLFVLNQRYDLDVMAGQFGVGDPDRMGGRRNKTEKECKRQTGAYLVGPFCIDRDE